MRSADSRDGDDAVKVYGGGDESSYTPRHTTIVGIINNPTREHMIKGIVIEMVKMSLL